MLVREIHIEGFKSIVKQTLPLGRVNCLIGANGVGKSNVLEAIGILSAAASGRVDDEAIMRRGIRAGLPRLYMTSFPKVHIPPHIALSAQGEPAAKYQVSLLNPLANPESTWSYEKERMESGTRTIVSRGLRGEQQNLSPINGLSALKLVELPHYEAAAQLLHTLQTYSIYCPNTPTLRSIVPDPQMRQPVGLAGGGLTEGVATLRGDYDDSVIDNVLELIEWASDVSVSTSAAELLSPAVGRGGEVLKFTDRFMAAERNTLSAYDASEGALYILFTAVLCLSPKSPNLFAIDNLDQALNPRLASRLAGRLYEWVKQSGPDRQMIFTAHNPAVLDGLDLADPEVRLFAVERNSEGHTTIRRVELSAELRKHNETYPLSRLWMMGNLGAVPNV
jgi:predicted ATPase